MSADRYLLTVGLEVHVQLASATKIFCGCRVEFGAEPNTNVCPVCLGLPGVLPVFNEKVFRLGLRAVLALGGTPSTLIKFDRKNYYYPDLPKGYQISQFEKPIGRGGAIEVSTAAGKRLIRVHRLHLEEDAGKLLHDQSPDTSFVDLNRAGTPLAEIVSEPDIVTADEAYAYLTNLKAILIAVGVSGCDMEKGQLRCDANISVRRDASDPLGTKVEVKNLNSFKAVREAILHEAERQEAALRKGEKIVQETRLWDDGKGKTFSMRSKEEAHDYRYFPEPDLVPFSYGEAEIEKERASLPELPKDKKERFLRAYGLSEYDAGLLTADASIAAFYDEAAAECKSYKEIANWITGPVFAYLAEKKAGLAETRLSKALFLELVGLVLDRTVSFQAAKEKVFPEVIGEGASPKEVVARKGLAQVSDDAALLKWVKEAIAENPKVVEDLRAGKASAAMFFVGQVMKKSQGKANPGRVRELVAAELKKA